MYRYLFLPLTSLLFASILNAGVVFTESFEAPTHSDVAEYDDTTTPTGWANNETHPGYMGLTDQAGGDFTTPYGSQAVKGYTSASPTWSYFETTASILNESLTAGYTYDLSFHVAALSTRTKAAYKVQLVAIDEGGSATVLDIIEGIGDGSSNMSFSDSISFTPDGSHTSLLGQRVAIQFGMSDNYGTLGAGYQDQAQFDNFSLNVVPEASTAFFGALALLALVRRRR